MNLKKALKVLTIMIVCLLFLTKANAQDTAKVAQPKEVSSLTKINLNVVGVSIEREEKIGKTTTLSLGAGFLGTQVYTTTVNYNLATNQVTFDNESDFKFFPALYTDFRHYYNFERRLKKGKKTQHNSANYVGLEALLVLPRLVEKDFHTAYQLNITPQYGFQRNIGKKLNFEIAIGPSVALGSERAEYGVMGKIALSFLL